MNNMCQGNLTFYCFDLAVHNIYVVYQNNNCLVSDSQAIQKRNKFVRNMQEIYVKEGGASNKWLMHYVV